MPSSKQRLPGVPDYSDCIIWTTQNLKFSFTTRNLNLDSNRSTFLFHPRFRRRSTTTIIGDFLNCTPVGIQPTDNPAELISADVECLRFPPANLAIGTGLANRGISGGQPPWLHPMVQPEQMSIPSGRSTHHYERTGCGGILMSDSANIACPHSSNGLTIKSWLSGFYGQRIMTTCGPPSTPSKSDTIAGFDHRSSWRIPHHSPVYIRAPACLARNGWSYISLPSKMLHNVPTSCPQSNHLETWSAVRSHSWSPARSYDFTDAARRAWGQWNRWNFEPGV